VNEVYTKIVNNDQVFGTKKNQIPIKITHFSNLLLTLDSKTRNGFFSQKLCQKPNYLIQCEELRLFGGDCYIRPKVRNAGKQSVPE
jgi:hypothetical protein